MILGYGKKKFQIRSISKVKFPDVLLKLWQLKRIERKQVKFLLFAVSTSHDE